MVWLHTLLCVDLVHHIEVDGGNDKVGEDVKCADIENSLWVIPRQLLAELGGDQDDGHVGAVTAVSKLFYAPLSEGQGLHLWRNHDCGCNKYGKRC